MQISASGPTPDAARPADDWRQRINAPDNEISAVVPLQVLLARNNDLALALVGIRAFTVGLQFDLAVRLRTRPRGRNAQQLHQLIGVHSDDPDTAGQRLLLGLEFADGRRVANIAYSPLQWGETSDAPTLMATGGGGGDLTYDQIFWLHPLPPPGPLLFVCRWPAFDLPETQTVIDGDLVARAAAQAVILWPLSDPSDEQAPEPKPPILPADGWFAEFRTPGPTQP